MFIFMVTGVDFLHYTAVKRWKDENDKWQKEAVTVTISNGPYAENYIRSDLAPNVMKFWKSVQDGINPYAPAEKEVKSFEVDYKKALDAFFDLD